MKQAAGNGTAGAAICAIFQLADTGTTTRSNRRLAEGTRGEPVLTTLDWSVSRVWLPAMRQQFTDAICLLRMKGRSITPLRYACGSCPLILAGCTRLMIAADLCPARKEPANNQFV
jgi:hypothetical protein